MCSFWLAGKCRKGRKCHFAHNKVNARPRAAATEPKQAPPPAPAMLLPHNSQPESTEWTNTVRQTDPNPIPCVWKPLVWRSAAVAPDVPLVRTGEQRAISVLPPQGVQFSVCVTGEALSTEFIAVRGEAYGQQQLASVYFTQASAAYNAGSCPASSIAARCLLLSVRSWEQVIKGWPNSYHSKLKQSYIKRNNCILKQRPHYQLSRMKPY